jgi:hypothetical protein
MPGARIWFRGDAFLPIKAIGWACVGRRKMRNVRGISLLEVLVILLMLALAAVASGPKPAF